MSELFIVGKIVNTHGIKGEVKVTQMTDNDQRFIPGEILYIERDSGKLLELTIEKQRFHKNHHLLLFKEINSINEAEQLKGELLKIKEEQLPELPEGEYYVHDIINCEVYEVNGDYICVITEVYETGANDVWEIATEDDNTYLIPYIEQVVKEVHIEDKKILIEPMEGLLE